MARCKHPNAKLVELLNPNGPRGFYRIRCDDCELTVMGIPYPVESRHSCHRMSAPPKWCQRLIDQERTRLGEEVR